MRALPAMAIELAVRFEGFSAAPYQDPVGIWTYGYGSTFDLEGKRVTAATPAIARDEAKDLLRRGLAAAGGEVLAALPGVGPDFLSESRLAALTDFTFNLGGTRFRASTLRRKVLDYDAAGVAEEFPKWRRAGGQILPGLVKRRAAERDLWCAA